MLRPVAQLRPTSLAAPYTSTIATAEEGAEKGAEEGAEEDAEEVRKMQKRLANSRPKAEIPSPLRGVEDSLAVTSCF